MYKDISLPHHSVTFIRTACVRDLKERKVLRIDEGSGQISKSSEHISAKYSPTARVSLYEARRRLSVTSRGSQRHHGLYRKIKFTVPNKQKYLCDLSQHVYEMKSQQPFAFGLMPHGDESLFRTFMKYHFSFSHSIVMVKPPG